ncbi:hypothetical protein F2P45_23800 [Massilia sp. CCM 8733]|uniref:Uncharacterized protein n=1 Tax=Massilia mucilaginosa TaxID=2609282 RepID=A0ABX0NZH1_9BURK|nr:hypothetical protein [Massilia mucilaginosa]NHZ92006.1 hypothetical protein [Massilia mucilaginosa]
MAVARFDLEHVLVDGTMVAPLSRTDFLAAIDTGRLRCDAATRQADRPSYGMRVTLHGQDFYMSDYQRDVFASRGVTCPAAHRCTGWRSTGASDGRSSRRKTVVTDRLSISCLQ